ncbi:MAG: Fic family protein [Legionellaceae bacterium]|nr:Fic family protein [Legionellaceae bacterium]
MNADRKLQPDSLASTNRNNKPLTYITEAFPPRIKKTKKLKNSLSQSENLLKKLSEINTRFPNPNLLLNTLISNTLIMKESIPTTGWMVELDGNLNDLEGITRFNTAIEHSLSLLEKKPLSIDVLKKIHLKLIGNNNTKVKPGTIRKGQVVIGCEVSNKIDYFPPKAEELPKLLERLEMFFLDQNEPPLAHAAICFSEFEFLHPFNDGNGRTGVILFGLMLVEKKIIPASMLNVIVFYLYAYMHSTGIGNYLIKKARNGHWVVWLVYLFDIISLISHELITRMESILKIINRYKSDYLATNTDLKIEQAVIQHLLNTPFLTASQMAKNLAVPISTLQRAILSLELQGVISKINKLGKTKIYGSSEILKILEQPIIIYKEPCPSVLSQ